VRWLANPVLHFIAAGAALFMATGSRQPTPAPAERPSVVITAAQVDELRATFAAETGHPPSDADAAALVQRAVDDELLYREALARGLDRGDRSIRNRIVEKMHALAPEAADPATLLHDALALGLDRDDAIVRRMLIEKMRLLAVSAAPEADDAQLQRYLDAHADRYRAPTRVSLRHVFLATPRHGAALDRDAGALLAELRRERPSPDDAVRRGDPFPLGADFPASTAHDLARSFGPDFAGAVMDLPLRSWSGPVASPYGRHLVWLDTRQPGDVPPLADVRSRVLEDWRESQRDDRVRAAITDLRARYEVRVEQGAS
jgi:hypothetical protein